VGLLIGFTGPPGCGKDAAADHLVTHHDFRQVAFADPIRQAALALNPMVDTFYKLDEVVRAWGWTDAKHRWPEVRRCLQVLGTEVGRDMFGPDIWINRTFQKIETFQPGQRVVITDVRFPNEAEALWARRGFLVRLRREAHHHRGVMDHRSETESAALVADYFMPNHGTLNDLRRRLDRLVGRLSTQRRN
jgi:hypothetical protein